MSAPRMFAPEKTPLTADGMRSLGAAWSMLERSIKGVAYNITTDQDQRDDLIQSAMVELWEIDPTRYSLTSAQEIGYVREILINRMFRVWGAEQGGAQRLMAEVGPALTRPPLPG